VNKARRILDLYSSLVGTMPEHRLPGAIAIRVGTTPAYVRTVARQRMGRGASEAERRYLHSALGKAARRRSSAQRWRRVKADPLKHQAERERKRNVAAAYRERERRRLRILIERAERQSIPV
jgi:hypothetical protein